MSAEDGNAVRRGKGEGARYPCGLTNSSTNGG